MRSMFYYINIGLIRGCIKLIEMLGLNTDIKQQLKEIFFQNPRTLNEATGSGSLLSFGSMEAYEELPLSLSHTHSSTAPSSHLPFVSPVSLPLASPPTHLNSQGTFPCLAHRCPPTLPEFPLSFYFTASELHLNTTSIRVASTMMTLPMK